MSETNENSAENNINNKPEENGRIKGDFDYSEIEKMLPEDFDKLFKTMPITEETECGLWFFRGSFWQRLANKKAYVFLYGVTGCLFSATYAYFNATISTLEKRYKIPSRNSGIISVGNDISQMFLSSVLSYYAGKGHRPRWMAFGLLTIAIYCFLNVLPHIMYGPGQDALLLTIENGAVFDSNTTMAVLEATKKKTLCNVNGTSGMQCEAYEGNYAPQFILFLAQLISGIGQPLFYTLGTAYMDDNIKKSKTATFISLSYFLRLLGPAFGYTLASFCLKMYISPELTPTIDNLDPRWLGAWWLGWIVLGITMVISSIFTGMFPKTLPRAAVRRTIHNERIRRQLSTKQPEVEKASLKDMLSTFKRLLLNATLMCNNISTLFYIFGYLPYWTFTPKYIETLFRQSASASSLVTGTVALAFSALGILLSGVVISKYKPSARFMAGWNVIVGICTVLGILSYTQLGCGDIERSVVINWDSNTNDISCNTGCRCDYVKYSPVCGDDGNTYISACHAGCKVQTVENNIKVFKDCSCVIPTIFTNNSVFNPVESIHSTPRDVTEKLTSIEYSFSGGSAKPGSCPVDCYREFVIFLAVMCFLKFIGSSGRAANFLVSVRCVDEKDKTVAMGFGMMLMSLFAFIPSPIIFGILLDKTCLVWGKTCSGTGNCWLYNGETLRWSLNTIAAAFIAIGTLFDVGVWYFVKNLKVFDEEIIGNELVEINSLETNKIAAKTDPILVAGVSPNMLVTFKRLLKNKTYMYNNLASMFYFLGYMPYWIFTPKYIEIQYRQSASVSSLVTGTVAVAFSAIGILLAGFVITKFKPNARLMALWNILVGVISVIGVLTYTQMGCAGIEKSIAVNTGQSLGSLNSCNGNCSCDYVKYSPVCGEDGNTYISACHAGCTSLISENNIKIYSNCSCVSPTNVTISKPLFESLSNNDFFNVTRQSKDYLSGFEGLKGSALPGSCPVNCYTEFIIFLAVMCLMKFVGASGRAANFLISVRCVEEKDKTVAMGFGVMLISLFSFIPSPILFGFILDQTCLVWGKTCSGTGNCWLYDSETLRWSMNTIAGAFIAIGALFDVGMWYYVKGLKIYDDATETELKKMQNQADLQNNVKDTSETK